MVNDTIRIIATSRWDSGSFAEAFAELGFPPLWREHEIREIPIALWTRIQSPLAPLSKDKEVIESFDGPMQGRFEYAINKPWWEARRTMLERAKADYQELLISQEAAKQLALEEAQYLAVLRAAAKKKLHLGA
jgi:hypothetical protein